MNPADPGLQKIFQSSSPENSARILLDSLDFQFALLLDAECRIVDCNTAAANFLGGQKTDICGSNLWQLLGDSCSAENRNLFISAVAEGKPVHNEEQYKNRWYDVYCRPLTLSDGQPMATLYCRDITDLKNMEQALKESNARFQEIAANLPGGIFQLRRSPDGTITLPFISDIPFEKYGIPRELILENHKFISDLLHPEDLNAALERLNESITNFSPIDHQFKIKVPSGEVYWLQATSTPKLQADGSIIWNGVVLDITERRLAEEALRSSEKRLSLAMHASNDGIWDYNLHTGKMHFSPSYYTMLGYAPYELPQSFQTWLDLMHPEDREDAVNKRKLYIEGYHEQYEAEFRMRTRNGLWRWILSRGKIVERDQDNHPLRMVGTHIDITERKEVEEREKIYEERLFQGQKLEAIGTLAGGIAHDFNNILSAIIGYTELLEDDIPEQSIQYSHLQEILKAGNRARDLIKQILAFSRQAEIEKRPVQVHLIIKETLKLMRSSIPSTIKIVRRIDPKAGLVMADPTQMHQIIMNLCTNAFHAMEVIGGTLEVELVPVDLDSSFTDSHPQIAPGAYIRLKVSDTGNGIDPKIIDRIFDPFFTTKEVGKGTGLGLATVHGIVSVLNGTITVESLLGKGTTFTVYLPRLTANDCTFETVKTALPRGRGEHILLVDDEDAIVRLSKQLLERLGYKVTCRTESTQALLTFKQDPHLFDLIITDYTMPDMTGIQLAEEIFRIKPDIPMILCTGYSEIISEEKARKIGIREYIMKPVVKNEIAGIIRKVLDSSPG